MRRQKRDMTERAYQRGYQAGISGRNKENCPHTQEQLRQQWLTGWREGRGDHWDGIDTATALEKQQAFH
ncbi:MULTISPECIES: ribosome modulation factor [Spongiibacter]|uniref:ribosome modulation factor n=1 Tax=Spongiibacter TaxID=630749 RepID=UPI0003B35655|nr:MULTISPECIES: ribosome modulation factor [Spongiibacter]MAY37751.1 ribosome modulation factor [Spongiibacter sp.]MBO6752132.1 ribosome modulation factor [Spongiibacter sp.]MBU70753.1 ribosome modulation factor [Spongiibacter sp.]|tara:strand:- start:866 stop:1072 length:207 start_codon:yes stop_codon:yes gene_type:complete